MLLDVTASSTYRDVLRAWIDAHPARSQTALARKVGASRSMVGMILSERRDLSEADAEQWGRGLGLEGEDLTYWTALVRMEVGPTLTQRRAARQYARALRDFRCSSSMTKEPLGLLAHWFTTVFLEIARTTGLPSDPGEAASLVWPEVEVSEAAEVLQGLLAHGLVVQDGERLVTDFERLASPRYVPDPIWAPALMRYHRAQLGHADRALSGLPVDQRFYGALTLCVPEGSLPELYERLHTLQLELIEPYRDQPGADTVVQVNFQLFRRSALAEGPESAAPQDGSAPEDAPGG